MLTIFKKSGILFFRKKIREDEMKRLADYCVNINKLRKKPFVSILSVLNILSVLFIIGNVAIF